MCLSGFGQREAIVCSSKIKETGSIIRTFMKTLAFHFQSVQQQQNRLEPGHGVKARPEGYRGTMRGREGGKEGGWIKKQSPLGMSQ